MSVDWSLYENRLNYSGTTRTARNIDRIKKNIIDKIDGNPSYKSVIINSSTTAQTLLINDTTKGYVKEILSLPDETFSLGDYILWDNKTWLVIDCDTDNTIETKGKMQLCNYTLPFQLSDGTIVYYPCVTSGKTYSNDENQVITLPSNQKSILLPFDEHTNTLKTGKRLFVDKTYKTPFIIEGSVDNTTYAYGSKGLIYFIVKQCELQETDGKEPKDNQTLGICNYVANYSIELTASDTSLDVGKTSQITPTCKTNGTTTTGTVVYTSSNTAIATISNTGLVTAISSGTVTITATWSEQNKSTTIIYSVASSVVAGIASINLSTSGSLLIDTTRTITAKALNSDGSANASEVLTWKFVEPSGYENLITETMVSNRQYKITVADTDDYDIIGKVVSVVVSDSTGTISKTLNLSIGS